MSKKKTVHTQSTTKERAKRLKNHPFIVPVVTFLVLFALSAAAFVGLGGRNLVSSNSQLVIFSHDGKQETLPTRATNVGEFIARTGIEVHEGDKVEPALNAEILGDNFKVNIYRARPIIIVDGERKIQAQSAATTPRSKAEQAGVEVYPEDEINTLPTTNFLKDGIGEQIVIDRSTPVHLNVYGTPVTARTRAKTVGDLLKEKQIMLGGDDTVQPNADTQLTPNLQVFITRKGVQIVTKEETTPPPVEIIEDPSLSVGASAVRQQGSPGKKLITYQIELQNNKEVARKIIQEVVVRQPVKQIMARGPLGSFAEALGRLRSCEGAYTSNTGNGYYGAYQFNLSTWRSNAPPGYQDVVPSSAPPTIQDQAAATLYQRRGWQPWPACSIKLGLQDIYR